MTGMFLPANTSPYWTYWMWGIFGAALFYSGVQGLKETRGNGLGWFFGYLGETLFGLFLMYYWFVRAIL